MVEEDKLEEEAVSSTAEATDLTSCDNSTDFEFRRG